MSIKTHKFDDHDLINTLKNGRYVYVEVQCDYDSCFDLINNLNNYIYLCVCIYTRDIIYGHEVMEGVGYGWGQKKVTRVRECFVLKHKRGKFVKNVFDHFVSYAFAFFKKGPLKVNLIEKSIIS